MNTANSAPGTRRVCRTIWVGAAIVLWLLWVSGVGAQGGDGTVELSEYRARLDRVIQSLEAAPASGAELALNEARRALASLKTVQLPSGETIEVQSPLTPALNQTEALARLRLLRDQLAAAANDHTAARQAQLRAILERPEFATRGARPSLFRRVLDWLDDQLPAGLIGLPGGLTSMVGTVIIAAGLIIIAILLSYWLQGFLRGFVANAQARRRQEDGRDEPLTAAVARQQAAALAEVGSYRAAIRQLYLAALLRLDEVGALRYDRSQTNREVLAQLPAGSATHHHLAPVIATFDHVWYGVYEPDQATYTGYAAEVDWLTTSAEPSVNERAEGAV